MPTAIVWIAGIIVGLLLNVTANKLPAKLHDPFLRWGWFGILLYFTYLVMSIGLIQRLLGRLGASGFLSYLVAGLIGATIALVYWNRVTGTIARLNDQPPQSSTAVSSHRQSQLAASSPQMPTTQATASSSLEASPLPSPAPSPSASLTKSRSKQLKTEELRRRREQLLRDLNYRKPS